MAAETPTATVAVADRHRCQEQGMSAPRKEANSAEAPQLTATRPNREPYRVCRRVFYLSPASWTRFC